MPIPPPNPESLAKSREALARTGSKNPFFDGLGLELEAFDYGYVKYRLPWAGPTLDGEGDMASGALLSAVDHAGALATWTTSEYRNPRYFGSTVKTQVEIFTPRVREHLSVVGRALGIDGDLHYAEVSMLTAGGELVARGTTIYRIIDRGEGFTEP